MPWLNQKGKRELELRLAIRDWRDYIVGGMRRRIKVRPSPSLADSWTQLTSEAKAIGGV